jgi:3-oxoacyl-[acyl-carrier-protein] synthase-3
MKYTRILGTGSFLPEKILKNSDLEKMVDTTDAWIVERTGIRQRHVVSENENALTMADGAGRRAMEAAGIHPSELDMIIVATTTPIKAFPSTACYLQKSFGVSGCPAFDLNSAACSGFMYGMSIVDQYIRQGTIKKALVIGSEVMSDILDWNDRSTCVLFGDGAGAVVLGASEQPGILSTHIHADGAYEDVLSLPTLTGRKVRNETDSLFLQMSGNRLFKLAVNILGDLFEETLKANSLDKSAVDWLIPHQANIRIIQGMAKKLGLPMDRVAITLDEQGNTSAASIPLALDKVVREGKVKRDQLLLLESFGGGLTWGSALVRY